MAVFEEAQVTQYPVSLQRAHEIRSSLCFIRQPVNERFVVGLDDFPFHFFRDREQRPKRAGEVAEFFVLPVEEALEDFHGQGLAGGEDGAQGGAHVFAEFLQIGKLALKPLAEDAAEALRELVRAVEREVTVLDIVAEAFGVEEHAFALFQDLADEAVGVRRRFAMARQVGTGLELRGELVAEVFAEVGAVGLGAGVEHEGVQPLQRGLDGAFRAAGDDEAEPVGQARGVAGEHFHERIAPGLARFVEGVDDDEQPLASAADDGLERVGEEVVEEFRRVFAVEFGDFRQGEQEFSIVGQAGGELEGEAADDSPGVAVVGLVPLDELGGDDFVAPEVGEVRGEGALADAGVAGDPEESGGGGGKVEG